MSGSDHPHIEDLIPHRGSMLLLVDVRSADDHSAICIGRVPLDCPLVDGRHRAPVLLGLEMGAQCAGVVEAVARAKETAAPMRPSVGYLVRIREASLEAPDLPAGCDLEVRASRIGRAHGLGIFTVQVAERDGDRQLVTATLTTMAAPAGR